MGPVGAVVFIVFGVWAISASLDFILSKRFNDYVAPTGVRFREAAIHGFVPHAYVICAVGGFLLLTAIFYLAIVGPFVTIDFLTDFHVNLSQYR